MSIPSGSGLTHLILTNIRTDIGDDGTTQTFSDSQLKIFIGKAATYLNSRLDNTDASGNTLAVYNWSSGDGTFSDTFNYTMLALLQMEIECLIAKRRYTTSIAKGIRVRDGDTEIDTSVSFGGYNKLIGDPKFGICAQVEKLIEDINMKSGGAENWGNIVWKGNSRIIEEHTHPDEFGFDRYTILPDFNDILDY